MPVSKYESLCLQCPLPDGCNPRALFCLIRIARKEDRRLTQRQYYERRRLVRSRPRRQAVKVNTDTERATLAQAAYFEAVTKAGRCV